MTIARPQFLLAICRDMRWTNAGVFATEREAEREQWTAVAQGAGDTQIVQLRASDDPQAVLASMKRSLVIALQGCERRLLIGFSFALDTPRRPMFRPTADAGRVVKFPTEHEARTCLTDVRPFAADAVIQVLDWQEHRP